MAASERWSYQVVEVRTNWKGATREAAQERLTQLGLQGWELVSVTQPLRFGPLQLYLKKPM